MLRIYILWARSPTSVSFLCIRNFSAFGPALSLSSDSGSLGSCGEEAGFYLHLWYSWIVY